MGKLISFPGARQRGCLFLALIFAFVSCNREKGPSSQSGFSMAEDAFSLKGEEFSPEDGFVLANDAAIKAAFTLDYRPQTAEIGQEAETLDAGTLGGAAGSGKGGGNTVIGGGLRNLAAYGTKYFDPATERERIRAIQAAQEAAARSSLPGGELAGEKAGPLTVIDWGPRGEFSASVQRPSVYVIFSQPMIPLASLGEPADVSPLVSIEPSMRGKFRWYGTSFLSFEGDEPCRSQQVYTITVNPGAASIYGTKISGETSFSFTTEALSLRDIIKGEDFVKRTGFRFDDREIPPQAARELTLVFNYPVAAADLGEYLEISTVAGGPKRFTLSQAGPERIRADIGDPVEFATSLRVTLKKGLKSAGGTRGTAKDQTISFNTPGIFQVKEFQRIPGYSKYRNLVELRFSQRLNESTLAPALSVEPVEPTVFPPGFAFGPANIEIWGSTVRIGNLPIAYGDKFRITVSGDVEDVYGRKLGAPYTCVINVPDEPPPEGEVHFLGWWHHMLEAQFPPRLLFKYRNIAPDSWYLLGKSNNPWADLSGDYVRQDLEPGKPNSHYFEEMDLFPFLNAQGKGFVQFRADINLLTSRKDRKGAFIIDNQTNNLNLQVTDLGLTVRYGFNKTVVLVSSLATGEPVEGAAVKLLAPGLVEDTSSMDIDALADFGSAVTDKNGLAVIDTPASSLRNNTRKTYGFESPYVYAQKDGDRAVFSPSSHNNWRFGIYGQSPQEAGEVTALTFMFSDRGLYKPGEKLSFRGVDRGKILGMYLVYQGDYTVTLEEDRDTGEDKAPVSRLSGTVTESGGFYGSMDIPDDLNPGQYRLVYRRDTVKGEGSRNEGRDRRILANIPVTVAYFERLKFQASLSRPGLDLISGEDINLNLTASYLSGGSLSGASWESAWYREQTVFHPGTPETRAYVFGPRRISDGNRYIAGDRGMLGGNGTASINQKTEDAGAVSGAAYLYQAEARVTDISNQMVTAYRSVLVHPARFSIGLYRKPGGFARSGEELSVDYITVDASGKKTLGNALFLKNGEDAGVLNVELIREEWRRLQQPGVNGYIYDQYVREQVSESSRKEEIRDKGSIRVKPSAAGFYTLRVSGRDRDGKLALTELSFYVTGSGSGYWNMNNAEEIRLSPDREMYNPGDTAQVLLQSNLPAGYYLITVEREGIFTEEVRHFTEPVSVIDIPVARNYVPVVYVSVSSYSVRSGPPSHEYGGSDLDKPKGYYGVVKLPVDPRVRSFSVKIESDKKVYRPGEEATVTLSAEQGGKPLPNAELTLMAVDRGVLDLIDYHVQDPIGYFYDIRQFPLAVVGGDSRAMLMDPVTYSVKNLAGGDGQGESKLEERKDFNPTAVFEPMLRTGADGKVRHTFKLPDNLTTYRLTVFGVRGDLFALKESEIAAQNRINVREVLPRRLRERDTAELGVLITNLDTVSHRLTVKLEIGEPDQSGAGGGRRKIPGAAFVDGPPEQRLTLQEGGNGVVYFDVAALREGTVSLHFTVNSDILNERLTRELVIEHPYVRETVSLSGSVDDGRAANTEGLVIPSFADKGAGNLSVTLDATRLGLLKSAVRYLFHYPYGCLEQRSAAVLPLVVFGEYLESFDLHSEVADPVKVVEDELKSWAKSQLPGGGFPYWPSRLEPDFYVSLRIAHIIAMARQKGIPLPGSLKLDLLESYLEREYRETEKLKPGASSYYYQSYQQAYMLYVLALLGSPVDASRLAAILLRNNADPSVLAFAGMSYRLLGRDAEAAKTAEKLRNLIRFTTRGADITDPADTYPLEKERYRFYGGKTEQLALSLQFFTEQFPGDQINGRLLHSLLENQRASGGYWENTAVTVRVLSAVDALIRAENLQALDLEASVNLGGRGILEASFRGLGAKPLSGTFDLEEFPLAGLARDSTQPLVINRNGKGSLYYTASLTYAIPSELQSFRDEGIGVFLVIYDVDTGEEVDGTALKSGKTYRARVRVSSGRDRTWLALRVPVPSGAEILDAAFVTTASYGDKGEETGVGGFSSASPLSHQAIMDNEIQYFWDSFDKGETTVSFLFRGVRRGVYPTPPVQAECMYQAEIFGRSPGLIYTIE